MRITFIHLNGFTMRTVFATLLLMIFLSCNQPPGRTASETATQNKALIRRAFAEMAAKQNYSLIDSFFAKNIFDHGALVGQEQGLQGFKEAVTEFLDMFSGISINVEDMVAEGDMVSSRETWKLTRRSDQKQLSGETMHWFRIKDGKITDEWSKGWEWVGL
jgi:predicted ester cyclase